MNRIRIASLNCRNYITNSSYVINLIDSCDIVYLIEHWLYEDEKILIESNNREHNVYLESDMIRTQNKRGRDYGGRAWIVRKNIKITNLNIYDNILSRLSVRIENNDFVIFGIWLPFDNGTQESFATATNTFALLHNEIRQVSLDIEIPSNFMIIGDFNSSLHRTKRFDKELQKFTHANRLVDIHSKSSENYTYKNAETKVDLDHMFCCKELITQIKNARIHTDVFNMSDHKTLLADVEVNQSNPHTQQSTNSSNLKRFHHFNWCNEYFVAEYKEQIGHSMAQIFEEIKKLKEPNTITINETYQNIVKSFVKAARKAEKACGTHTKSKRRLHRNYIRLIREDPHFKSKTDLLFQKKLLAKTEINNPSLKEEVKQIKKEIKQMQIEAMREDLKNEDFKLESEMSFSRGLFWKRVRRYQRRNRKQVGENLDIEEFAHFYSRLFSHEDRPSNDEHKKVEEHVKDAFERIKNERFDNTKIANEEIAKIINNLKNGKASGADHISNELVKHASNTILLSNLSWLFEAIINTGIIPDDFNTSILTPIPKKGNKMTPEESRPISVSSVFCNIFEQILLNRMEFLKSSSSNQFGYKKKTSCKHAFFTVNETIHYFRKGKSDIFAASLDASKAFDKLWRAGLFEMMIEKAEPVYWRILYRYYCESKIIVKIMDKTSKALPTTEGVKQGGILSSYLFTFFMNSMLNEVLELNVGALVGNTNVSITSYCDDVILLASVPKHMQIMIDHCASYAKKWKITFNAKKSTVIKFGKNLNYSCDFQLYGEKIPETSELIYLGLPIGTSSIINEFMCTKMNKVEKAFYSLHTIGCKPLRLRPKTIALFYKSMCQSILQYGIDIMPICKTKLNEINVRQSTLLKKAIGVNKFSKSTTILDYMQIEDLFTLSHKATLRINEQIKTNHTTANIYNHLREHYKKYCPLKESFFKKLNKTIVECRVNINITTLKEQTRTAIETLKSQKHPHTNHKDVVELLELLNREGSSSEENKTILQEINHLLKYNSLQQ